MSRVRGTMSASVRRASKLQQLAIELLILMGAGLVYVVVREVTEGNTREAIANARSLHAIEEALGINWELAMQGLVLRHVSLFDLANWMYVWGHWPVIAISAVYLYGMRRDHYRYLRTAVIASGIIGFLFFACIPTAPPRLVGPEYVDTVSIASGYHETFQPARYTNLYAAMPSLHFGWNLLLGIVLFASTRLLIVRVFAVMMPVAMAFSVIATANHWVLDVVVGFLVVMAGLAIAEVLHRRSVDEAEPPVMRGLEQLADQLRRRWPRRLVRRRTGAAPRS